MSATPLHQYLRWTAVAAYGVLIAVLSLRPDTGDCQWYFPHADKVAHLGMYAGLMLLLMRAFAIRSPSGAKLALGFGICTVYGILMEYGQLQLGMGRTFSAADIAANISGAAITALALWIGTSRTCPS